MRTAVVLAASALSLALVVLVLLALIKEGVTLGTLILVVPSVAIVILLLVGIGGAFFGPRGRG